VMRRERESGLGIGEVGVEMGARSCGSYRQIVGVGSDGFLKRMAVSEMVGKFLRAGVIHLWH